MSRLSIENQKNKKRRGNRKGFLSFLFFFVVHKLLQI